MDTIRIHRH